MKMPEFLIEEFQLLSCVQLFAPQGQQPARLLCPCNSPGQNTEVSSHFLLQGIFLIQGLNLCLLYCRWILYLLSNQGCCCCCQVTSVVSDSVRPHRQQPIRLPRPQDSPGKNTGVGCHFLLQCMKVKSESEVTQLCPTLCNPTDCSPPGSSSHGIFLARVLEWGAIAFSKATRVLYC